MFRVLCTIMGIWLNSRYTSPQAQPQCQIPQQAANQTAAGSPPSLSPYSQGPYKAQGNSSKNPPQYSPISSTFLSSATLFNLREILREETERNTLSIVLKYKFLRTQGLPTLYPLNLLLSDSLYLRNEF